MTRKRDRAPQQNCTWRVEDGVEISQTPKEDWSKAKGWRRNEEPRGRWP